MPLPIQLSESTLQRWRWCVKGQVQGVGFRPYVYRLAVQHGLTGVVYNDVRGVLIEGQADEVCLTRFEEALSLQCPPQARVTSLERMVAQPLADEEQFRIALSDAGSASSEARSPGAMQTDVAIDLAVCDACIAEVLAPAERRFDYALTNCTNCGPRYSIVKSAPYDRARTTMAGFELCDDCRRQYNDPADRRFHAQPIACPNCGPRLSLVDGQGGELPGDPLDGAARVLDSGGILAIKGIGGFHLATRADMAESVERLRIAKQRDAKPLAVMCRDLRTAQEFVVLTSQGARWLTSAAAPIVLAPLRGEARVPDMVCARVASLGRDVAVHSAPLPAFRQMRGRRLGDDQRQSKRRASARGNEEAIERLGRMCDAMLWHDRPIQRSVDDSVILDRRADSPVVLRRAPAWPRRRCACPPRKDPWPHREWACAWAPS